MSIVGKKLPSTTTRPFSHLIQTERPDHFISKKANFGFEEISEVDNKLTHLKQQQKQQQQQQAEIIMNGTTPTRSKPNLDLWLKEVVELRKKAGEYKVKSIIRMGSLLIFITQCNVFLVPWLGYRNRP